MVVPSTAELNACSRGLLACVYLSSVLGTSRRKISSRGGLIRSLSSLADYYLIGMRGRSWLVGEERRCVRTLSYHG